MKKFFTQNSSGARCQSALSLLTFLSLLFLFGCEKEKVTVLYGTVTDKNKQPVDSILVIVEGVQFTKYTHLGEALTDENGAYSITITSRKYSVVDIIIPFWPTQNPKYMRDYDSFFVTKNDVKTNNCCTATAGKKTKYDFELISK